MLQPKSKFSNRPTKYSDEAAIERELMALKAKGVNDGIARFPDRGMAYGLRDDKIYGVTTTPELLREEYMETNKNYIPNFYDARGFLDREQTSEELPKSTLRDLYYGLSTGKVKNPYPDRQLKDWRSFDEGFDWSKTLNK